MLIKISKLNKEYIRGSRSFSAVNNVDLIVNEGDFINIIGRSGSGKSTLINMVAGMISPTSGEIEIEGIKLSDKTDDEISFIRNQTIGFIPQGTALLPNLNIMDNVCLPFFLYKREGDVYGRAMALLQLLGIDNLSESYPKELSGGEQRRVLIARSLINSPKILIADEPTSDLDIENTKQVMELFSKINKEGTTLMIVSHELDTLAYGNRVVSMSDGNLTNNA